MTLRIKNMDNTNKHLPAGQAGIQITRQGLKALKEEFDQLQNEKRPKLVERLAHARSQGDLAENSDYQNARDDLEFLDGRISELENVIKKAKVVRVSVKRDEISFGTKVTIKANSRENIFEIVGEWEADPARKRISHTSPLGQALIGKKVGEKVEVDAPAGKVIYQIVKIH